MSHDFGTLPNIPPNEEEARSYLKQHHWPEGFQSLLLDQCSSVPVRFFICDDSGSMYNTDGQHLVSQGNISKPVQCSRWVELTESLLFHLDLAHKAQAPCEFRLLNQLSPKFVGDNSMDPDHGNYRAVQNVFKNKTPTGGTPLCRHITDVVNYIKFHEARLREDGQVISLVICTDGMSSDGNVVDAMRPLKHLPCMVVIRLCTDEDAVITYWDSVEKDLEMELDIVDDFFGEGSGVRDVNPWINYGLPLQRLREFGVKVKELDMIDERKLTTQQMIKYLSILFNCEVSTIPQPDFDWGTFEKWVKDNNTKVQNTFNPNSSKNSPEPWINISQLNACYNPNAGGCCQIN